MATYAAGDPCQVPLLSTTAMVRSFALLIALLPVVFAARQSDDEYDLCSMSSGSGSGDREVSDEYVHVPDAKVEDFAEGDAVYVVFDGENWVDETERDDVPSEAVQAMRLERDDDDEASGEDSSEESIAEEMARDIGTSLMAEEERLRDVATQTPTHDESDQVIEFVVSDVHKDEQILDGASNASNHMSIDERHGLTMQPSPSPTHVASASPLPVESPSLKAKELPREDPHLEESTCSQKPRLSKRERREAARIAEEAARDEREKQELKYLATQYIRTQLMREIFLPDTPEVKRTHFFLRKGLVLIVTLPVAADDKVKLLFSKKPEAWDRKIPPNVCVFK